MRICIAAAAVVVMLHASNARAHMTAECLYLLKTYVFEVQHTHEESRLGPDPNLPEMADMNWAERSAYLLTKLDGACVWINDQNLEEIRKTINEAEETEE